MSADGARAVTGGETARCGCGTWRPDGEQAALTGHLAVFGGGGHAGRRPGGHRRRDGHGAGVGPGLRRPSSPATSAGVVGGGQPDGARAVTGGGDGTVRVWDLATGRELATLTAQRRWRWRSRATGPRGQRRQRSEVQVWDLATGGAPTVLTGHRQVWAVAVSADGATAVSGGGDGTVRVWDLATGRRAGASAAHGPVRCSRWRSAGRGPRGHRRRGRHGAGVGPGRPAASGRFCRPQRPGCGRWRSPRTGPARSPAARTDGAGVGPGHRRPGAVTGHTGKCGRWRSPRTGPARSPAARTARCGCGTWPVRRDQAQLTHGTRAGGGGKRGREPGGYRLPRRHRPAVGSGHRKNGCLLDRGLRRHRVHRAIRSVPQNRRQGEQTGSPTCLGGCATH